MKICNKCKRELNESQFNKNCKAKDGLCTICKECQRLYREENKDKIQAYRNEHKQYYIDYDKKRKDNQQRIEQKRQNYLKNQEYYKEKSKIYHIENRDKHLTKSKQYYQDNKEKLKAYNKQYYIKNKDKHLNYAKQYRIINKTKLAEFDKLRNSKLDRKISKFMHRGLTKANIQDEHWENYFNYSLQQLKEHLESQFTSEMNWSNYGKYGWHIDHIIPQCMLPYNDINEENFKICWSLTNLRPLWYSENLSRPKDGSDVSEELKQQIIVSALKET